MRDVIHETRNTKDEIRDTKYDRRNSLCRNSKLVWKFDIRNSLETNFDFPTSITISEYRQYGFALFPSQPSQALLSPLKPSKNLWLNQNHSSK